MVTKATPSADIAPTLARLSQIVDKLIETGDKARDERDFTDSIGAFVQATNVLVTAHQLQERHAYTASLEGGESQPPGPNGLRGRFPISGLDEEDL